MAEMNETTPLAAAWRYRRLVAVCTLFGLFLGMLYSMLEREESYLAEADLILQPGNDSTFTGGESPNRFITNQLEILRSTAVAQRAIDILDSQDEASLELADLEEGLTVIGRSDSDLIRLTFTSEDPIVAVRAVNAVASAYQQLTTESSTLAAGDALANIAAQLDSIEERREEIDQQIAQILAGDPVRSDLNQRRQQLVEEILDLTTTYQETSDPEVRSSITIRIAESEAVIEALNTAAAALTDDSELAAMRGELDSLIPRQASLQERRGEIEIDSELAQSTVSLFTPATFAEAAPTLGMARAGAAGTFLGLVAGGFLAFMIANRARRFSDRIEPEMLIGAPLLADIPDFSEENLATSLPIKDAPRSAAAEAIRFAATAMEIRCRAIEAKSVAFVSGTVGHGKTTLCANTALASASKGREVLLVDVDFGNQALVELVTGAPPTSALGLSDILEAGTPFDRAITRVQLGDDVSVSLLGRGQQPVNASDLLRKPEAKQLFQDLRQRFDLVLVDTPPLLQVAYTTLLTGYVDTLTVVVDHMSSVKQLQDLAERMRFIGVAPIGYLYNRSPLRREMLETEGSMRDILGSGMPDLDVSGTASRARDPGRPGS